MGPVDIAVNSLDKVVLQLFQLKLLVRPVPGICGNVGRVDVLVILDESIN